ncbi:MAG TPA: M48 family metallopeptidase [Candidatus Dormibacteraeota bacterium]|jgi:STE24 endopeptidase|nr:M48 family metallopeptidase [Candidatus Dormibacteraeota bacterium]
MVRLARLVLPLVLLFTIFANGQTAAPPVLLAVPAQDSAATAQVFNVEAAVDAYLAKMPPAERARSDAYFEGGYWLQLWDFLATVFVMWLLLRWRWSTGMRNLAERITHIRPVQTALYWVQFSLATAILTFPLTVYESYFREHNYDLLNQTFGPWMREQLIALAVVVVLGAILVVPLVGLVRVLGKSWWVWGAALMIVFLAFVSLIEPVYLAPLFNKYTRLEDPRIRDPILTMANANGIPATDVWEFDASRQSNRVSANVGGFGNTQRISLNDNLLKRCTLAEIEPVMGHEMGHYVLNHEYKGLVMNGVVIVIGFAFLNWGINFALARWGQRWDIRGITDVAALPLAVIVFSVYSLLMTPVSNSITRTMEYEADMFGLNVSRQPDGEANVDVMLGEYRKLSPGPVEEFILFDHPSGRTRITAAMRWKAGHPETASPEEMARPIVFATR